MNKLTFVCILMSLSTCCLGQPAKPSDLQTVRGFLEVCSTDGTGIALKRTDAIVNGPTGEVTNRIKKAMDDTLADYALCLAYVNGLFEGWKEGHEHGVLAAHFPAGVPHDLSEAFKALPTEELKAVGAALSNGVPCTPENMTFGELKKILVDYLEAQVKKNPLLNLTLTSRFLAKSLHDKFPCPAK